MGISRDFSDQLNKGSNISGKIRSNFVRKFVLRKKSLLPTSFCRRATLTYWGNGKHTGKVSRGMGPLKHQFWGSLNHGSKRGSSRQTSLSAILGSRFSARLPNCLLPLLLLREHWAVPRVLREKAPMKHWQRHRFQMKSRRAQLGQLCNCCPGQSAEMCWRIFVV